MCREDEPREHEQSDDEQSENGQDDQPVSEDEYQVDNDADPGEAIQAEPIVENLDDDKQSDNENHDLPVNEVENHVGNGPNPEDDFGAENACGEDDSEIEYWELYEELKEEPFEMEPLRESLDNTANSDCVLTCVYKIE